MDKAQRHAEKVAKAHLKAQDKRIKRFNKAKKKAERERERERKRVVREGKINARLQGKKKR